MKMKSKIIVILFCIAIMALSVFADATIFKNAILKHVHGIWYSKSMDMGGVVINMNIGLEFLKDGTGFYLIKNSSTEEFARTSSFTWEAKDNYLYLNYGGEKQENRKVIEINDKKLVTEYEYNDSPIIQTLVKNLKDL